MEKNKLKAVIFDLDGVITDSAAYHYLAWKSLAEELGIPFDEQYNEKLKGISRMESLELILKNSSQGASYSLQQKEALAEKKNDLYKELIRQISPADLLPGIAGFLKELKENQVKIALASVSRNAPFILRQLGLDAMFDYVADAAAVPNAKPFPDIFLAGMQAFGLQPQNCFGVEDARAGIEAIHRAGMQAVGVGTPEEMEDADLVTTTDELRLDLILDKLGMEL
ncbi:MAG: beta-phosphoglucomutase [Eubacterium sp.]|nr:beta-phosphoglucomutase [Eubacterium sp.]